MWSIGDMKRNGWAKVKIYYWSAFAVTLICSLLGGGASQGGSVNTYREYREDIHHSFSGLSPAALHMIITTLVGVFAIVGIAALLFKIFIGNPVVVGKNRFFYGKQAVASVSRYRQGVLGLRMRKLYECGKDNVSEGSFYRSLVTSAGNSGNLQRI